MLLDTGATHTIFDIKFINNLSINLELSKITAASISSNMENNFEVILPSLQLGSLVIKNYKTYALNLDYINNIYLKVGLQKISGIVGNDILVEYKAKIDYENLILLLNDK
jgi:predicted aspartyl protease